MTSQADPSNSPRQEKQPAPWIKNLGLFSVIIGDLIGCVGAGVGLGYWAWKRWGAPWWVVLLSSLAGLSVAMYRLYQVSLRLDGNDESKRS